MMKENEMKPCFFCGIRCTDNIFRAADPEILKIYRVTFWIPTDVPVGWAICDECQHLDLKTIERLIYEDMTTKAVKRYRAGLPTVIPDDETLKVFERIVQAIRQRKHAQRQSSKSLRQKESHRTSTTKTVKRCPRCGGPIPNPQDEGHCLGYLSRVDRRTEICSVCSEDEDRTWPDDPWQQETWVKEQRAKWKE